MSSALCQAITVVVDAVVAVAIVIFNWETLLLLLLLLLFNSIDLSYRLQFGVEKEIQIKHCARVWEMAARV